MGLYLMVAGTKNRKKSLEESFTRNQLKPYVSDSIYKKLNSHFKPNEPIFIWGANKGSVSYLEAVQEGEYVLDFKNQKVPTVFQFCFWFKTPDTKLQEFIGWDEEKPKEKRRPYRYVYFLKSPQKPKHSKKEYYGQAFGYDSGPRWLMGQRYINDKQLGEALNRTNSDSAEEFLGIKNLSEGLNSQQRLSENKQGATVNTKDKSKKDTTNSSSHSFRSKAPKEGQKIIEEGDTGVSYDKLFSDYLTDATDITVVDPYIRLPYQIRNFMEFAQVISKQKGKEEVLLHLVTNNHDEYLENSEDAFTDIRNTLEPLGIFFTYEFDENIHDRYIKTDTGWKIVLGRGLDIFHKTQGKFDIAELNQEQRQCKACEITYLRIDG